MFICTLLVQDNTSFTSFHKCTSTSYSYTQARVSLLHCAFMYVIVQDFFHFLTHQVYMATAMRPCRHSSQNFSYVTVHLFMTCYVMKLNLHVPITLFGTEWYIQDESSPCISVNSSLQPPEIHEINTYPH